MKKCKSCQMEIDDKASICPHCRTKQKGQSLLSCQGIFLGVLVLCVLFVVAMIGGSKSSSSTSTDSTGIQRDISEKVNTPTPTDDPNPHFTDGTHEVGKDIQPGTYRTRKPSNGCYFSRLKGFSGSLSDIIMNENTDTPAIVTIAVSDAGFKSSNCGTWTQDVSAITTDKTTFTDGMYIVGTDIEPGKYKNSGSDGCYYSRLANFSGALGGIIMNENTDEPAIITIATSDKGFKSSRCGTWTKMN